MNQGKLEVVKQEMARVNVDILGISEIKWTGMGEFNSVKSFSHWLVLTHLHLLWNLTGTFIHLTLELHHYTAGLFLYYFFFGRSPALI